MNIDKPSFKFTCYPYDCPIGSSPNVLIEHTVLSKDLTRSDLLEQFEYFMKAASYYFENNEHIDITGASDGD
jgi:hypothetical protein|tara:strand:- start:180 stop:395 length:216 start_codon:yes stop_codon:yes gene_type:complete